MPLNIKDNSVVTKDGLTTFLEQAHVVRQWGFCSYVIGMIPEAQNYLVQAVITPLHETLAKLAKQDELNFDDIRAITDISMLPDGCLMPNLSVTQALVRELTLLANSRDEEALQRLNTQIRTVCNQLEERQTAGSWGNELSGERADVEVPLERR